MRWAQTIVWSGVMVLWVAVLSVWTVFLVHRAWDDRMEAQVTARCVEGVHGGQDPTLADFASRTACEEWFWFWRGPKGGWESRYPDRSFPPPENPADVSKRL